MMNPLTVMINGTQAQQDRAIEKELAALSTLERMIGERRRNIADGHHYSELNMATVGAEVARHAEQVFMLDGQLATLKALQEQGEGK